MYLTQGLHRAVQQTPDGLATIYGERVRTWAESADRVARFAGALHAHGVGAGDRVGLLAVNSDIYHEAMLAIPWADAVVNPVNTRWSAAEIAFSLDDSGSRVLIVDDTFAQAVPELRQHCAAIDTVIHAGDGAAPEHSLDYETLVTGHDPVADARRGGDDLGGIYYTGGTTGKPKGVMLSHANLLVSALGACATGELITPRGRVMHAAPMFHLADMITWVAGNLLGATHVMVPGFTPTGVADAIARHQVTDVLLVPTMIQMLVDSQDTAGTDLSSLRRLLYAGSPISEALVERTRKRLPTTALTQVYGMTENAATITLLLPHEHDDPALRRAAGRAEPHNEIRVVDPQDNEVPVGTIGEIVLRGPNVMLGYWNRPEQTAETLRDGWMHTGDSGYVDERGYVFLVDRIKDMIVSGGENVYSVEVENALCKHPAVAACAVIGIPDETWGESVHAVVVPTVGHHATQDELRAHAKTLIAGYKAPRTVEFVEALPISGAGKVLKNELRAKYWPPGARGVS